MFYIIGSNGNVAMVLDYTEFLSDAIDLLQHYAQISEFVYIVDERGKFY